MLLALRQTLRTDPVAIELQLTVCTEGKGIDPSQLEGEALGIGSARILGIEVVLINASVEGSGVPVRCFQDTTKLEATLILITSIHIAVESYTRLVSLTHPVHHISTIAVKGGGCHTMSILERIAVADLHAVDKLRLNVGATYLAGIVIFIGNIWLCLPDTWAICAT